MYNEEIDLTFLICPYCSGKLKKGERFVECTSCSTSYKETENGQVDFRLKKNKKIFLQFIIKPSFSFKEDVFHINKNICQETTNHIPGIRNEVLSYFPTPDPRTNMMLDLGCGEARNQSDFERIGFKYIGLDYDSNQATFLGDAHALPFKDESFDFVFSNAVFEHLQYPFVAANEVYRVMKPKSRFVGSAAFLEPFHGMSFYHQSHYGLLNSLEYAGFKVIHLSPNSEWDVLTAQATMSLFPKMPNIISRSLVFPLRGLHKIYWKIGHILRPLESTEIKRQFWTAGSFDFVAIKT